MISGLKVGVVIPVFTAQVGVDLFVIGAEWMPQRDKTGVQRCIGGSEFFVARVRAIPDRAVSSGRPDLHPWGMRPLIR